MTPKRWNISPSLSLAWDFIDILFSQRDRFVLIRYTQGYNGRGSDVPELMLNIHMEGSRDYAQHLQIIFSCVPELHAQHKTSIYPCAPKLLAQHKTSHQSCALGSMPNTHTHTHLHVYHMKLDYTQYIKQNIMFICTGVFHLVYQNKT